MAGNTSQGRPQNPTPRVFACANCGASVPLRAIGLTVTVACPTCGALIDATNPSYRILRTLEAKTPLKPLIPLGTRGKLQGITWEVIGFMQRTDAMGRYPWQEYLLFNPYHGFRWLTEADGHWNFVRMTKSKPMLSRSGFAFLEGRSFRLFHRGGAKVRYVIGEFYWRVKVNEAVRVADYISPPFILSSEENASEITWSIGEYIAPEEVKKAFGIKRAMPLQKGIAPNQLSPLHDARPKVLRAAAILIGAASLVQLSSCVLAPNHLATQVGLTYSKQSANAPHVTPPFHLPGGSSNVAITLDAPVKNSWLSVEGELVNDTSGAVYPFSNTVEFYEGYGEDGYWSNGHTENTVILSGITKGTYHLNVETSADPSINEISYLLQVRRGVPRWRNFFLALILLSLYPLWIWWRDRNFDIARWSNSDYSPYDTDDDD